MKKVLLILVLSFIATLNYAQGGSAKSSPDSIIRYSRDFWGRSKYSIAGKQVTGNEIYARLTNYPPSAFEFKECKKYNNRALYSCGAVLAFLAASSIANGNSNTSTNTTSTLFFGVGCGLLIPSLIFGLKAQKHGKHSFELYNQQFQ